MSYYNKNIELLKIVNPNLVEYLSKQKCPNWISLSSNNNFIVKNRTTVLSAYDIDNPKKQIKATIKKMNFYKDSATIMIGIGLGHTLDEILKKKENQHTIIIAEPEGFLIKKTLEIYDFSKYIKNGSLLFACPGKEELVYLISYLDSKFVINNWNMMIEPYVLFKYDVYSDLQSQSMELVNQIQCNTGTVMGAGAIIAENDILNLPYIIRHRGIIELKDIYKDKPCICVSTGPSLQKNIHKLIGIGDNVIIIAVAQALRVLLAYDITPDFICTVDYGEVNIEHFKGLADSDVSLIALNRTYKEVLKLWKGSKFIASSGGETANKNTIVDLILEKGTVEQGGSVSHMVLGTAIHLGCNPITMIGQDLSFEKDLSHIPLVDAGGKVKFEEDGTITWDIDDPRCCLQKENKGSHGMGQAIQIEGYFGNIVYTNIGLQSFLTSFEGIIKNYENQTKFYNSTEGGANIKGAENLTLENFLNQYCIKKINKDRIKSLLSLRKDADELIDKAIERIKWEIKLFKEEIEVCDKALKPLEEMKNTKDKNELKKLLDKKEDNFIYASKAQELAKQSNLLQLYIYKTSRLIQTKELNVNNKMSKMLKDNDILLTRIKRTELILTEAKNASDRLIKIYNKTLKILIKYKKTKDEGLLINLKPEKYSLKDAEKYFNVGNWAHPLLDAKNILRTNWWHIEEKEKINAVKIFDKAMAMKWDAIAEAEKLPDRSNEIEYIKIVNNVRKIGRETKDFDKTLNMLKEAKDLMPDKQEARWGLASTYYRLGDYDSSIKEYEEIIELNPDNFRYKFELGQVYIMKNTEDDIQKGINLIKKVMDKTHEYDRFFLRIAELYDDLGCFDEAIDFYDQYLKIFPSNPDAWLKKGLCYKKQFKTTEHEFCINKAIQIGGDKYKGY